MIRRGRPEDLPTVRRLQSLLPDPTPELLAATRPEDLYVAVDVDGRGVARVVGYLLPVDGEDRHLAEAVVDPDRRREGYGRALFEAAIDDADRRVTLLVAADNEGAIRLYRDLGFVVVEDRPDAYDAGAGLFMARPA